MKTLWQLFSNPLALLGVGFAIAAVLFGMAGCKTAPQTSTARIAVLLATSQYIQKLPSEPAREARAARITDVVTTLDTLAAGDATTIGALRAYVTSKLPADLTPQDKLLIGELIRLVAEELQARVGEGVLDGDAVLKVRAVLGWVREGAAGYLPPTVAT